ncbi:hypothetical protein Ae201684P_009561 [Aphanomyces euteiches]|uniref:Uncharacterized protein n=1 Tax=Aphanomyces euteiches TaxID=100861 RepID=A0A6G0WKX1_9STRA|nr:hypothetical protein Ae201684_014159 [Aphanomyces euteiches]KAH9096330.1 hypothetical protein Ae201684P_009561 [Aphanomyces euteiches]
MQFQSAAPRYDLQVLSNGDVQSSGLDLAPSWPLELEPQPNSGFSIGVICANLFIALVVVGVMANLVAGFELILVNNTAWSYTRSYGCFKKTKHYKIELMGRLKTTTVIYDRDDDDGYRRYSRQLFGFDYGGQTISMGSCFLDEEIEPFINHLKDYLPNHIKPQAEVQDCVVVAIGVAEELDDKSSN